MKSLLLSFACVAVSLLLLLKVEAKSMPKCPEECGECPAVNCTCGTVKDDCGCCDVCRVCANEACLLFRGDVCQEGYNCTHPEGTRHIDRINKPGTCLPH